MPTHDESIRELITWMGTVDSIPGTEEYIQDRAYAERYVQALLDQGMTFDKLKPARMKAAHVFPDIVLDSEAHLHSPDILRKCDLPDPLSKLPSGFFQSYLNYTRGSLAPHQYDFLMAISVMGAWKTRTCWINMGGRYQIFPASSVALISLNPGLGKGLAMNQAKMVLRQAGYTDFAPDRVSPSKLFGMLAQKTKETLMDQSAIAVFATEMAGFFREGDVMTGGLLIDLADLMDMPPKFAYATRKHDLEEIRLPTLQIAAASNMDWLIDHMPKSAFTGGWFPRQYVSLQSREHAPDIDQNYPAPPSALQKVLDDLENLNAVDGPRGPMKMTRHALNRFIDHRKQTLREIKITGDERIAAYLDRLPTNTLRLAMLFTISQGKMLIRYTEYDLAQECMEWLAETHVELYERVGLTIYGRWRIAVENIIKRGGDIGVTRQVLKQDSRPLGIPMPQLDAILDDLIDSRWVEGGALRMVGGRMMPGYKWKGGKGGGEGEGESSGREDKVVKLPIEIPIKKAENNGGEK